MAKVHSGLRPSLTPESSVALSPRIPRFDSVARLVFGRQGQPRTQSDFHHGLLVLFAANLVAWPIGFFLLSEWLNQFVYRIDLHLGYFALSGGAAALVALITVALQALPAARANPVESLRHA